MDNDITFKSLSETRHISRSIFVEPEVVKVEQILLLVLARLDVRSWIHTMIGLELIYGTIS